MSEVETRLAEIPAEILALGALTMHNWWSPVKHEDAARVDKDCHEDAAAFLEVLYPAIVARVRTDTIEECAKAVEGERMPQPRSDPYWRGYDAAIVDGLAAVRGVSHEH